MVRSGDPSSVIKVLDGTALNSESNILLNFKSSTIYIEI